MIRTAGGGSGMDPPVMGPAGRSRLESRAQTPPGLYLRPSVQRSGEGEGGGSQELLSVLLVEDNPGDAELMSEMLREGGPGSPGFSLRHVVRLADAEEELATRPVDVVLLDLSLPDGRGLDSLAAVRRAAPEVPVVVMTGLADDEVALRAVQAGAQDYLVKGRDGDGAVRRAVRYAVERQRLARMAQQAVAARDEMLAIVSHDLRSPIGIIGMCAQALLDPEPVPPESAREMGAIIDRSCDWMLRLIGDLLDVTRLEAGMLPISPDPLPVAGMVEALVEMHAPIAAEKGVTLRADVAAGLPRILADGDRLVQALGNLVGNAIKFTPAGGLVTLHVEHADEEGDRDARDSLGGQGGERPAARGGVRFRLRDTGQGIAADTLEHVFDRFWQARSSRRGGAGLGLAIARGIVEAHGGTIEVASELGVGTTFTCTFPPAPLHGGALPG